MQSKEGELLFEKYIFQRHYWSLGIWTFYKQSQQEMYLNEMFCSVKQQ